MLCVPIIFTGVFAPREQELVSAVSHCSLPDMCVISKCGLNDLNGQNNVCVYLYKLDKILKYFTEIKIGCSF